METEKYQHELIVPNEGMPFKIFPFEGAGGGYVREKHWHSSVEIFAIWEGQIEYTVNDTKKLLNAGEFVIFNSNEVHSIIAPKPNRTVVLQIPQEIFSKYYTDENFIWFTHSEKENDDRVFVLLQEMFLLWQNAEAGFEFQVLSLYYELLHILVTKYRKLKVQNELLKNSKQLTKLTRITRYMKEHYAENLSLDSMAEEFNYSPSYLSRMFQKHAGINFKDYLLSIRLEHAVHDLEEEECQIIDIALKNGFPNSKAFSNAFRDKYGMLPSQYKKLKN